MNNSSVFLPIASSGTGQCIAREIVAAYSERLGRWTWSPSDGSSTA